MGQKFLVATFLFALLWLLPELRASEIDVSVQCKIEGPIYRGALVFDSDIKSWRVEDCHIYGSRPIWTAKQISPPLRLTFNGIEYVGHVENDRSTFSDAKCEKLERIYVYRGAGSAEVSASGFSVGIDVKFTRDGKVVNVTLADRDGQTCIARPQ